jgi:hypothetical protein
MKLIMNLFFMYFINIINDRKDSKHNQRTIKTKIKEIVY